VLVALPALLSAAEPPQGEESAEEEAAPAALPSSLLGWGCMSGPDTVVQASLIRAAGLRYLGLGQWQIVPPRAMPDGAALAAAGRALAWGRRPPPEYAPLYWPDGFPFQQLSDFADDFLTDPNLSQDKTNNPFSIARDQAVKLVDDREHRRNVFLAAAAYWLANRDAQPEDIAWTLFKRNRYVTRDAAMSIALPLVLKRLPASLTEALPAEGQVYADLRILSYASFDSAASLTQMLLTASRRGMKALAVADLNNTAGSEDAEIVADRLKRQGRLPADFTVIPAQTILTATGNILALFTRSRILDATPVARAVREIHAQGGIAIDLHPGDIGGAIILRRVPFDGYIVQPTYFEMFRTLEVMGEADFSALMTLYAGNSPIAAGVGLLHSTIEADSSSPEALRQALREHRATASSALMTPWIAVAALKPIGPIEHTLNRYFITEEKIGLWLGRRIGARYVRVDLNWDDPVRDMMGLLDLPTQLRELVRGTSVLRRAPKIQAVRIDFDYFSLVYEPSPSRVLLQTAFTW
jgi:hypothetical protein